MSSWSTARRVLAIRLDSIGDVLMTTPAMRAIKEAPSVEHLTLLTSPAGASIARLVPEVDEVIVYEAPWMKAGAPHAATVDRAMIARLADAAFDAAVVFTVFSQTPFPAAMLAYLAGVPLSLAHTRERAYKLVSDAVPETEPETGIRHEVQRHLDLVAGVGWRTGDVRMSVRASNGAITATARLGVGGRIVVHPGSTAESRRWPADHYARSLRLLAGHGHRFVVTGDASEIPLIDAIVADAGVDAINLGGRIDLDTLVALIAQAPLLISNNTGPAHIAAATGTPVVDLYALTNPQHTPWGVPSRVLNHDVECRWCFSSVCRTGHHLCLRGVAPEQVAAAALDLMGDRKRAAA